MSYQTNGPLILFGSVHCAQDQHKSYQCSCQIPLIVSVRLILVMRLIKTCSSCLLDWEHMKYFENDALTAPARKNGLAIWKTMYNILELCNMLSETKWTSLPQVLCQELKGEIFNKLFQNWIYACLTLRLSWFVCCDKNLKMWPLLESSQKMCNYKLQSQCSMVNLEIANESNKGLVPNWQKVTVCVSSQW